MDIEYHLKNFNDMSLQRLWRNRRKFEDDLKKATEMYNKTLSYEMYVHKIDIQCKINEIIFHINQCVKEGGDKICHM
jgi:hypothetical protein